MDEERKDPALEKKEEAAASDVKLLGQRQAEEAPARIPAKEPAETPQGPKEEKGGFDFGRLLFGLLTISFGAFLLGKSTGFIPTDLYIDIFQFWPVLIVVVGLSLLDTRRPFSFLIALLAFAAVAAYVGTVVKDATWENDDDGRLNLPIRTDREEQWNREYIFGPTEGV